VCRDEFQLFALTPVHHGTPVLEALPCFEPRTAKNQIPVVNVARGFKDPKSYVMAIFHLDLLKFIL